MQESPKLHTCCPSCGAAKDSDTDTIRHYTCGTVGSFITGGYTSRCSKGRCLTCGGVEGNHEAFCRPRATCSNCDSLADLVQVQAEEIKRLRAALAATGCNDIMCNEALRECVTCETRKV